MKMFIVGNLLLPFTLLFPMLAAAQVNYIVSGNTAYVASSPSASGNVVIADTYSNYPVTSITGNAFSLGRLTGVTIGNNVTNIGQGAFSLCSSLTNVTMPDGVLSIGNNAFFSCSILASMTIPASVTNIGTEAFSECGRLTNITVAASNLAYSSLNGVLFDEAQETLIQFPGGLGGSYAIPNSVTSIGEDAFASSSGLTSLNTGNNVTNIGAGAFEQCSDLTNITFLGNSPALGVNAFSSVAHAATVYYYAGTSGWTSTYGGLPTVELTWPYTFTCTTNNAAITITGATGSPINMVIPTSINGYPVTSIGGDAFYDRTSVASVTIPNSITNIGGSAFSDCSSLTNITIGNSVTGIGDFAFYDCFNLTGIIIPGSVASIGNEVFEDCASLTDIAIPASVTGIGEAAFAACTNLTNISVTASNPVYSSANGALFNKTKTTLVEFSSGLSGSYTIPDSVTNLADGAFTGCSALTSVTIPASATNIGNYVFEYCSSLGSITLPAGVADIGISAFSGCSGLTNVTIPNSVTNIGQDAFYACSSLTSMTIPSGVTDIGLSAFLFCSGLTKVTLGNGVTNLENDAFYACSSLTDITFLGNAPTLGSPYVFNDVAANATVYYHAGTSGWTSTYDGLPTVELSSISVSGASVQAGSFIFTITGTSNQIVTIEASTNLVNWQSIWTNTLSSTSTNFTDAQWKSYSRRFYRAN